MAPDRITIRVNPGFDPWEVSFTEPMEAALYFVGASERGSTFVLNDRGNAIHWTKADLRALAAQNQEAAS